MSLVATDLHVELGGTPVVRGVSLHIEPGSMVAIVGPNGSGKSTLVRTLAGVLKPASGRVETGGRAVRSIHRRELARRQGLLAQHAETPGFTTVREHVELGRHAHRTLFARGGEERGVVDHAMRTCEVSHLAERRMEELSGGERQRVRLATLLAQDPKTLLLDEPLVGLDIEHQLGLLDLLADLNERGRTIVCVLHDLNLAIRYFPRLVVVHDGRIAADGDPGEVLCPVLFESVFGVDGRVGCERDGTPVVMCSRPGCEPTRCGQTREVETPVVMTTERARVPARGQRPEIAHEGGRH